MNKHYADNATYLDTLKLCKDCKWCLVNSSGLNDAKCSHPEVKTYLGKSFVTGEDRYELPFADNTRIKEKGKCGEEGRLFEYKSDPIRERGKGGRHEPNSIHITQDNCHEYGFRWDNDSKRFL